MSLDTYPTAHVEALEARLAALEAENKQAREDEAWALDAAVTIHPDGASKSFAPMFWSVRYWDGVRTLEVTAPTIHAALRPLRAKVEGGCQVNDIKLSGLELETVLRCVDKVFETRAAVEERDRSIAALEAENKALRDRLAQADADQQGSSVALRAACEAVDRFADRIAALRNAGNALARHVAEDPRGQTARKLVEAWEEASR